MPLFNLGVEGNVPTVYSAAALLYCSALLALIAYAKSDAHQGEYHRWRGLALIFFFLCVDEAFEFHERLVIPVRSLLSVSGLLYFAWVIPYGILVSLLLAAYAGFIRRLPVATRLLFLLAGATYLAGAIGFELIEGLYVDRAGGRLFSALTTCKELLEMAGVVVFIYALLSYMESEMKLTAIRISFHLDAPPPV